MNNTMKRILALALTLVMACSLVACGGSKKEEAPAKTETKTEAPAENKTENADPYADLPKVEWKFTHSQSADHFQQIAFQDFADYVKEQSGGKFTIELFHSGTLGTEQEVIESMQAGSIQGTVAAASLLANFVPCYNLFSMPALFKDVDERHIIESMNVNATAVMRIIHYFYDKISSKADFFCGVMVSIAGFMSSPFFAVYGASKAALKIFIESVNVELEKSGTTNRILNVSPGSIKGTGFNNGKTDLGQTECLAKDIIKNLYSKNDLLIPQYDEIFKTVLERYGKDFREEGRHSYDYKLNSGRIKE